MVDHHVDRPDVDARQRVQLTGTNRSFGLIALINQCPAPGPMTSLQRPATGTVTGDPASLMWDVLVMDDGSRVTDTRPDLRRPGGFCEVTRPDPIPNSAVKRLSANGTMSQDMGESVAARPAKIGVGISEPSPGRGRCGPVRSLCNASNSSLFSSWSLISRHWSLTPARGGAAR